MEFERSVVWKAMMTTEEKLEMSSGTLETGGKVREGAGGYECSVYVGLLLMIGIKKNSV